MQELAIQAVAMTEQVMLAEMLAVIGNQNDQRIRQNAAAVEFVQQLANVIVQVSDAAIVGALGQGDLVGR